jgi:glycosyltransferase involved in cell wall biosynthesis
VPRIALITPCAPSHLPFLQEAHTSILAQEERDWEWAIQIDGPAEDLPSLGDPRISVACNSRSFGAAISRNRALTRTTAPLVYSFDGDDVLCAGALGRLASALEANLDCAFVNATLLNWHEDGRLEPNAKLSPLREGRIEPGEIERVWRELSWHALNTGVTMYRREYLLAAGQPYRVLRIMIC